MYSLAQDDGQFPHTRFELRTANARRDAAAFDFGCARGWEQFAVFIANNDGSIMTLSPVAPPSAVLRRDELTQLMLDLDAIVEKYPEYSADAERSKVWLESSFFPANPDASGLETPGDIFQCFAPVDGEGMFCHDPEERHKFLIPAVQASLPINPMPPVHGTAEGQEVVDMRVFPASACPLPALHTVHAHGQVQGVVCTAPPLPVWASTTDLKHGRATPGHAQYRGGGSRRSQRRRTSAGCTRTVLEYGHCGASGRSK